MNDVQVGYRVKKVATMLTYDITRFFDTIPHLYLIQTLCKLHVPPALVQWIYSFLQNRKASISLDGKMDHLAPVNTGVPQGSCTSPILATYFTAPLGEAIALGAMTRLTNQPTTLTNLHMHHSTLSPHTLYIDDGSIIVLAHTREEAMQIVKSTFKTAHNWLKERGLKMDQVKCELIHFTKTNRGRHSGPGPSITIPTNTEGISHSIPPSKTIKYLGMWIDSCLTLNKHVKKAMMKAMTAAHSLRLLGNSERGIHQSLCRQLYYGTILPIPMYGLPLFWKSCNGQPLNHLTRLQTESLHLTTGAFKTTHDAHGNRSFHSSNHPLLTVQVKCRRCHDHFPRIRKGT